jgi:ABC-2 type transport system permease protein
MKHPGWALMRGFWLSWLQYRSFLFILAFGWMIPPLIYMLVWMTVAGAQGLVGFTQGEFVAYYLVLILVNQITYAQTNWTVGDMVRTGEMNRILMRPVAPVYEPLASEIACKIIYLIFDVPLVAGLALILNPQFHVGFTETALFIPALLAAWALRFLWGYWLALLAFWATKADALLVLQDTLVFLLGGQVAPIMLLPVWMRDLATVLPFRYMVAFPVELLTGQVTGAAILNGFLIQTGWLVVAYALTMILWKNGVHRYGAVGG